MKKNTKKLVGAVTLAAVAIIASVIIILSESATAETDGSAVGRLMADASAASQPIAAEKLHKFELQQKEFAVNGTAYPYLAEIMEENFGNTIPEIGAAIPRELQKYYGEAQELVNLFVEEYFSEDEATAITTKLEDTPLVVGDFSTSETLQGSAFVAENGKVYMNGDYANLDSAELRSQKDSWMEMLTHELVHGIKQAVGTDDFVSTKLDEAMTDVIAVAICQCDRVDEGYKAYRPYAYMLLGQFGKPALKAYFYGGYDKLVGPKKLQAYAMLTETSGITKMADGLSDADAYCQLAGLPSVEAMYSLSKELLS